MDKHISTMFCILKIAERHIEVISPVVQLLLSVLNKLW